MESKFRLLDELTLEEWIHTLSKKELSVLLMGVGTSLLGHAIIGVIMALLG